jgi:hypothetical protein
LITIFEVNSMLKFIAGVASCIALSSLLLASAIVRPGMAQTVPLPPTDPASTGFAQTDRQNGVTVDSRGFRSSWVSSSGNTLYTQPTIYPHPIYRHGHHHPTGQPTIVVAPGTIVIQPGVIQPGVIQPQPRVIIAPTIILGNDRNITTICTTTNTITSSDGTIVRSTTTQPCAY